MSQIPLFFDTDDSSSEEDFIVSQANQNAVKLLESWPGGWASHAVMIYGPTASGKTHLAKIWQQNSHAVLIEPKDIYRNEAEDLLPDSGACILEDIEKFGDEVSLLHFFNSVKEIGGTILMTAKKHPKNLGIRLADLRSRLNAIPSIAMSNPDENMLKTILHKQFADRQLKVSNDVVDFLVNRMERSFAMASRIVKAIDHQALVEHRNITVPLARRVLESL